MTIYEALEKDHEQLKALLDRLVEASDADQDTRTLLDRIRDELVPHSRAEEAIFYNNLRAESDWGTLDAADSFREHAQAETILRTLRGLKRVDGEWTAAAKELRDGIFSHIEEEESETFARARETFTEEEAQQMGEAFEQMKPEIRKQGATKNMVEMAVNMLPKRLGDRVREAFSDRG